MWDRRRRGNLVRRLTVRRQLILAPAWVLLAPQTYEPEASQEGGDIYRRSRKQTCKSVGRRADAGELTVDRRPAAVGLLCEEQVDAERRVQSGRVESATTHSRDCGWCSGANAQEWALGTIRGRLHLARRRCRRERRGWGRRSRSTRDAMSAFGMGFALAGPYMQSAPEDGMGLAAQREIGSRRQSLTDLGAGEAPVQEGPDPRCADIAMDGSRLRQAQQSNKGNPRFLTDVYSRTRSRRYAWSAGLQVAWGAALFDVGCRSHVRGRGVGAMLHGVNFGPAANYGLRIPSTPGALCSAESR